MATRPEINQARESGERDAKRDNNWSPLKFTADYKPDKYDNPVQQAAYDRTYEKNRK